MSQSLILAELTSPSMLPDTSRQRTTSTCWPWSAGLARAAPAAANIIAAARARARSGERNILLLLADVLLHHYLSRRSGVSVRLPDATFQRRTEGRGNTGILPNRRARCCN